MLPEALITYLHYLSIFLLVSTLVTEFILYKQELTKKEALLITKADSLYGLAAILIVISGFLKVYLYGKGSGYYWSNIVFNIKLSLFIIVGLLSIYPTIRFIKWRKFLKGEEESIRIEDSEFTKTRAMIRIEVTLVFLIPLLAALMARGFGV